MSIAMMGKSRVRFCRSLIMIRTKLAVLAVSAALALSVTIAQTHKAQAQAKLTITAVTQPFPTQPQYIRVDQPLLRDGLKTKSNGTIDVKLSAWPEMSLTGPEVLRLVRAGQVDIGASPLSTVSGDVPFLDGVDLAGLHPQIDMARQSANALVPQANKELERFGSRIVAVYPFPAQVIFCRQPVTNLADLKGRKIRTFGASLNDFVAAIGGRRSPSDFPKCTARSNAASPTARSPAPDQGMQPSGTKSRTTSTTCRSAGPWRGISSMSGGGARSISPHRS
jgi:TRAP-type transport system periplasmic protein